MASPQAAAADLAEHYARILGQQADRQVSDITRTCLLRLPSRLPIHGEDLRAVEELIARLVRLGEVGARDPVGSPRQIDDYIARRLGEPASGPRSVYRALRAMLGRTVLVERHSRQIWVLRLFGLTDSSSKLHRALLTETPAPFSLPAPGTETAATTTPQPSPPVDAEPSPHGGAELREALAGERLARVEADQRRAAADAELGTLRAALEEERRARGEADRRAQAAAAQLGALERELDPLRRALDEARRARDKADREGLAGAAHRTELERELGPLRRALDEERRAHGEADRRGQVIAAQLIEFKQQHLDALRDHKVELERLRTESARGIRDARAADAATVWRLIEANRAQDALAFITARMDGHDVEASVSKDLPPPLERSSDAPAPDATARTEPPAPRTQPLTSAVLAAHAEPGQPRQGPPVKPNKVGRNEPCPCGSGNKYKRCCGRFA
ncbi:MAG: SEC-C domain-containing protein [Myxococcales bacterium]|nr:SEC-C domain-containing protein [Myxococcales bacterium]